MANYGCAVRTNYFRVIDEERYKKLFEGLVADEDTVHVFDEKKNGVTYHGFGAYGSIDYVPEGEEDEMDNRDFDMFLRELQKILPEDESFMLFEAGNEKLRYVTGYATVVTRVGTRFLDLNSWALEMARDMLNDEHYNTQTMY